jgi:EAL domain-containing protein (putative c-di-GMP-specific phosphodiesterase class I)
LAGELLEGFQPVTVTGPAVREGLRSGSLRMLMQPIIDLRSGEVRQVEALARLALGTGPERVMLSPADFLPHLEADELDLLFREGLDLTLAALTSWDRHGLQTSVSINLAPSTLRDPHCPEWVSTRLAEHELSGDRLVLELLETEVLESAGQLISLARLRSRGVALALDDFGTGHSTPGRLAMVRADYLKLDRSMTSALGASDNGARDAVTELIELGRAAGCEIVMEGIETAVQMDLARALGADLGQGYYFARPMPAERLPAWLIAHRARWRAAQLGTSG